MKSELLFHWQSPRRRKDFEKRGGPASGQQHLCAIRFDRNREQHFETTCPREQSLHG